jgi:hypothetical protein
MKARTLLCLAAGLALLAGCSSSGPERAEVSGTVKLNGVFVEEGSISFIPVEGTTGPEAGTAIRDGKYHMPRASGAVVGRNRVVLRTIRKTGRKVQDPTAPPGVKTDELVEGFPRDHNLDSTVIREVESGSNTFDFDVHTPKLK